MSQPEARLARAIRLELTSRGVFVFKVHGSSMMMAGLPDLIGCANGRFIAIECKMPGNKASRIQELIHSKIEAAGGRVIVAYSVQDALKVLRD
ncbi:holliday junction resolvase [Gordonia phage GiKK]|nr:holliday junction resolvase [Gordonia phage GiKK]UVK63935.1 nuclease [Gordonia phage Button]WKW84834.1 VRR-Nuc domain protein [Gordonia phage Jamzy]